MTTSGDEDDDRLLADLRAALRGAGEPTPAMAAAGAAAWSWRAVDAELLELDSTPGDERAGASQRDFGLARAGDDGGPGAPRMLSFGRPPGPSVALMETDEGWLGRLHPAAAGEVTVLGPDGPRQEGVPVDELGTFAIARPAGSVRLRLRTASAELLTDWCVLR